MTRKIINKKNFGKKHLSVPHSRYDALTTHRERDWKIEIDWDFEIDWEIEIEILRLSLRNWARAIEIERDWEIEIEKDWERERESECVSPVNKLEPEYIGYSLES